MSHLFGNDYMVVVKKESVYGTNPGTLASGSVILQKTLEFVTGEEVLEVKNKTLHLSNVKESYIQGRKMPTCTISGELDEASLYAFANAITDSAKALGATGTYELATGRSPYSYTIARYFVAPVAGKGQIMTGAVCTSFKISIPTSGPITFQASFRGKTLNMELDTITGTFNPSPYNTVLQAGDLNGFSMYLGESATPVTELMQMELDITREMADDNVSFGMSFSRMRELTLKTGGTCSTTSLWSNSTGWIEPGDRTDGLVAIDFSLQSPSSSRQYDFSLHGEAKSISLPDPDRGIYQQQIQIDLADDADANDLFSLVVSS